MTCNILCVWIYIETCTTYGVAPDNQLEVTILEDIIAGMWGIGQFSFLDSEALTFSQCFHAMFHFVWTRTSDRGKT